MKEQQPQPSLDEDPHLQPCLDTRKIEQSPRPTQEDEQRREMRLGEEQRLQPDHPDETSNYFKRIIDYMRENPGQTGLVAAVSIPTLLYFLINLRH